jgi:hypothetical protein
LPCFIALRKQEEQFKQIIQKFTFSKDEEKPQPKLIKDEKLET